MNRSRPTCQEGNRRLKLNRGTAYQADGELFRGALALRDRFLNERGGYCSRLRSRPRRALRLPPSSSSSQATGPAYCQWREGFSYCLDSCAALASPDPSLALNVFQDGPGGSPELLASFLNTPVISQYRSEGTQAGGFVRGSLFRLPGGSIDLVAGAEWREESILFDSFGTFVSHGRNVTAGYGELRLPIANALAVTAAARLDHYNDFGDTLNPQFGLTWRPMSELMLRASYGTSFRAPSLFDLHAPRRVIPGQLVSDPARSNVTTTFDLILGGNPDLEPTEADSLTAGFVFTPDALAGFRLSATYWQISLDERISVFSPSLHLAFESQYPERVVRGTPTADDVAAGIPGILLSIDSSRINFGRLKTNGIDLSLSHEIETGIGRFFPGLSGTWVGEYRTIDLPGTPEAERVGIAHDRGTIPRWRGVASLGWSRGGIAATAMARHVPKYRDATVFGVATGRTVPSQTLVDLQASLDFSGMTTGGSSWLDGLRITGGLANVFDEKPHFAEVGANNGYDLSQGDLRQRSGYVRISKTF